MLYGPIVSVNYEANRKKLREIAKMLIDDGYSERDVYRGIGYALGILGKIRSTESRLNTYRDKFNVKYFIAESYTNKSVYYMVKTNNDSYCNCPRFVQSVINHTKNPDKYKKIGCKHIIASKIIDMLR